MNYIKLDSIPCAAFLILFIAPIIYSFNVNDDLSHINDIFPMKVSDIYNIYIEVGESGFYCWGFRGPALVLFLFYVNVSGMRARSRLSSQPLKIPVPWALLQVRWSIPLVPWFHPG